MKSSAILDRVRVLLAYTAPFDQLTEEEREDLLGAISIEYFEPDAVVVEQGSRLHRGLYLVESGLVRLMDVERQRLIDKCGEGDLFGSFGLVQGGASIYEARAVEATVCALLDKARFAQLYGQHEAFKAFFDNDIKWYLRHQGTAIDVTGAYLLFSRRLGQLAHRAPVTGPPSLTAREAAQRMTKSGSGTLLVMRNDKLVGIVTDSDLRTRLVARGRDAETPVQRLMTSPVVTIAARASLFEAMTVMLERRVRCLVITEDGADPKPLGILTHQDLTHFRGLDPVATVTRMERVGSVDDLADIRAEMSEHLLRLYQQGVVPEHLERLAAVIYDRIAVRVLQLVEHERKAAGEPRIALPWVWLRLGSSGRHEMALHSTQHNAILFADAASDDERAQAEQGFRALAERANAALEACGFTMSDIVAGDPRWCMPLRSWKRTYRTWVFEPNEEALAAAPIFFDIRGIYGDLALVDELKQDLEDALNVHMLDRDRAFFPLMAERALTRRPPLSFFRRFVLERSGEQRHRFNIRERGILPVVDAARVLALETRFFDTMNTFDRLRHAAEALPDLAEVLDGALDAYHYLVDFRLEHQLSQIKAGAVPDNHIDPALLTSVQRNLLRSAFAAVVALQKAMAKHYEVTLGPRSWTLPPFL